MQIISRFINYHMTLNHLIIDMLYDQFPISPLQETAFT